MTLQAFGQKLRNLRRKLDLSQRELAAKVFVSRDLISIWERGYQYRERSWQPDRQSILRLCQIFAEYLTPVEAETWASWAGHQLSPVELQEIFGIIPRQTPPLTSFYINRFSLQQRILEILNKNHILVLSGMGGIGKSTLATWLAHTFTSDFPDGVIWVDNRGKNEITNAQEWIARSFGVTLNTNDPAERAAMLRSLLHGKRCLLVLDDIQAISDLTYINIGSDTTRLLITTRDAKVADVLSATVLQVPSLSEDEGLNLLATWAGDKIAAEQLVSLLGGHPLALSLSGAQLRAGITLSDLLAEFQDKQVVLEALDMDDPQDRLQSLTRCFDLSYEQLSPLLQVRFAQLSCFISTFDEASLAAVWQVKRPEVNRSLRQFLRLALVQPQAEGYELHPLLRTYAAHKLSLWPQLTRATSYRHAAWFIRRFLYHPGVLGEENEPTPILDRVWSDVVAALRWASRHEPQLAAWAVILAHTERPALLKEIGPDLITAVADYAAQTDNLVEQALLHELLGDLYLLDGAMTVGLTHFNRASNLWEITENGLASSRAKLRVAGVYLLQQNQLSAAEAACQAQTYLERSLPLSAEELKTAYWLFYWFDMIYNPLTRWEHLPESDVAKLAKLAKRTDQPVLEARGLHIYRMWCTAEVTRPPTAREMGSRLALAAYKLWRTCGRRDRADDEISWTQYQLTGRYSQRVAARFAQRRSHSTPRPSPTQVQLIKDEGLRWWLSASDRQRVDWLSRMLPRYLGASNYNGRPLIPNSRAWYWVKTVLNIGALGNERRYSALISPPSNHLLNGPEWLVLTGQKALPLTDRATTELISQYLATLENLLK